MKLFAPATGKECHMSEIWIVTANDRRARILGADSPTGSLTEIADLVHPIAQMRAGEFVTDAARGAAQALLGAADAA